MSRPKRKAACMGTGGYKEGTEQDGYIWDRAMLGEGPYGALFSNDGWERPAGTTHPAAAPHKKPATGAGEGRKEPHGHQPGEGREGQTERENRASGASAREGQEELEAWMSANRNTNTTAAYASAWKQFDRWVNETVNPVRQEGEKVDSTRPSEIDVAGYMRYVVTEQGRPISAVTAALAAIADKVRYATTAEYNPCQGKRVAAMRAVLVSMAPEGTGQKTAIGWAVLCGVVGAARREERTHTGTTQGWIAARDATLILLAYYGFLRGSEVVRMRRGEVRIGRSEDGADMLVVKVDRMAKNDAERKGHERLVTRQTEGEGDMCAVEAVRRWLTTPPRAGPQGALFPTEKGGEMSVDTPRGRLKHWLTKSGVTDAGAYGFHSLRAGGATQAAKNGVSEEDIKRHGNWKSDAVRAYIRPDEEDRLGASAALGGAAAAAGGQ